jgi:hypothetical protein
VTDRRERRTDHALRRRIDQLLGRVHAARDEIVERGLDAVQDTKEQHADGDATRPRSTGADNAAA